MTTNPTATTDTQAAISETWVANRAAYQALDALAHDIAADIEDIDCPRLTAGSMPAPAERRPGLVRALAIVNQHRGMYR